MPDRFEWIPGRGPDAAVLERLCSAFPRPTEPMGEAWFMGAERKMYQHLLDQDAERVPLPQLEQALVEIASGPINMMWLQEWHDWFHYLLGRLIPRSHEKEIHEYLVENLVTAFLSLYPRGIVGEPYTGFKSDVLRTLAVCNMHDSLWRDGHIRVGAMLWESKDGRQVKNCRTICGDFSCLMFFCIKYLDAAQIAGWV